MDEMIFSIARDRDFKQAFRLSEFSLLQLNHPKSSVRGGQFRIGGESYLFGIGVRWRKRDAMQGPGRLRQPPWQGDFEAGRPARAP